MMLINRLRFLYFFVILLLLAPIVLGVSIRPAKRSLDFEPNLEAGFSFSICGADMIRSYIKGDLVEYATLIDDNQDGGCREIGVGLKLPAKIEKPGRHRLLVGALELVEEKGSVGGRAAIQAPIYIFVPYPGLYVEMSFEAPNVNLGETVHFKVNVNNLGTDNISSARAVIDVYDDYSKLKTLNTNEESIASKTNAELFVDMATTGMKDGSYKAVATLYYDGKTDSKEKVFNIGTLYVTINNYTKELEQDKINKFDFDIESKWNNLIKDVYGKVTINGVNVKTPNYNLEPWDEMRITTYYDTTDVSLGEYNATITVFYEDKTTTKEGKVYVVEHIEVPSPAEAKEEKPWKINIEVTPITLLIAIIVLLVAVDIVWLVARRKKRK